MSASINLHVGASCFNLPWHRMRSTEHFWLIEPNEHIRRMLIKKIHKISAKNTLTFRSAITTTNGPIILQSLSEEFLATRDIEGEDEWMLGISRVKGDLNSGRNLLDQELFIPNIVENEVDGRTLDTFLYEHMDNSDHLNSLVIDTEGHDFDIINSYSFRIKPRFLKIEHKHCTGSVNQVCQRLESVGYTVYVEREDIYAHL